MNVIGEVKQMKIDIVKVISKYVELRKLGPGYAGICPFCGACGTTDFVVSFRHQSYACGKCGAKGGMFQFLLNLKGASLQEALNEVSETFNIPLNADFLDSRWNEYLRATDYQKVLAQEAERVRTLPGIGDSVGKVYSAKESLTYTELATFIRCPLEYKLRYRDKEELYVPGGTHVNVGRLLHSIATQFLKEPTNQRNEQSVESRFQKEMAEKRNPEYVDELVRFREPTIMLLTEYFVDKPISKKSPHFRTNFGPLIIAGTADCLISSSEGIQIIEFKEYDYREFEEDMEVTRYLQLLFYFFGLGGREAGIYSGAYGFFNSGYTDEVVFSDEIIGRGKEFIQVKSQQMIECQEFIPKLNALCVSCGYKDKCKLQAQVRGRI